jgi:hypothetical protein
MDAISTAGLISRPVDSDQDGEKCGVAAGITACEERRLPICREKRPWDPFLTMEVLYQLSYVGAAPAS